MTAILTDRTMWHLDEGLALCRAIEKVCPRFGYHVALTGGLLYRGGLRKDADILFYSIRNETTDQDGLFVALKITLGIELVEHHGFVVKAMMGVKSIDFFFPEHDDGEYGEDGEDDEDTEFVEFES
jgi:hypothetical protein